jgi:predicted phosphodiesterase
MTRLAILADIHGNLPALHAVMEDMVQFRPDHVIVAGDMINWGPFSVQVMEIIRREGWAAIRGNNEYYLLDYNTPRQPPRWKEYVLLPWLYEQLQREWHHVIAALPDELSLRFPDAPPIRVVHGIPGNCWVSMNPHQSDAELMEYLEGMTEPTIIGAHSHIAMHRHLNGWQLLNPGSVGVPLDGERTAAYMILDGDESGWQPTFRRIPFDLNPLLEEFARQGFTERCGVVAELVIQEFITARLAVHPFNEWQRHHFPDQSANRELLTVFQQVDPWLYIPPPYHINRK